MIYFLINNNFCLYNAEILSKELKGYDLGLIQIPYSLKPVINDIRFKKILTIERLTSINGYFVKWPYKLLINLYRNYKKIRAVKNILKPDKVDILLANSEEELMNQVVIKIFREKKAKVFLYEGGMGNYISFNMNSEVLSTKEIFLMYSIRFILGIKGYLLLKNKGHFVPRMSDKYFAGVLFFLPHKIKRNIQVFHIKKLVENNKLSLNENNTIFLTQPMYRSYFSIEEYIHNIDFVLSKLTKSFSKVYIKPHPEEIIDGIIPEFERIALKYSNVYIINSSEIIERIINDYDVKFAVSYFSTSLLNLLYYRVEPVFIFHLLPEINDNVSKEIFLYLKSISYLFPRNFEDINSRYRSGLRELIQSGQHISEILSAI
jgi:hypothetical protein